MYLIKDCLVTLIGSENVRGETMLKFLDIWPSPQTLEIKIEDGNAPLRVATRALGRGSQNEKIILRRNNEDMDVKAKNQALRNM